jgi:hypothetical protein
MRAESQTPRQLTEEQIAEEQAAEELAAEEQAAEDAADRTRLAEAVNPDTRDVDVRESDEALLEDRQADRHDPDVRASDDDRVDDDASAPAVGVAAVPAMAGPGAVPPPLTAAEADEVEAQRRAERDADARRDSERPEDSSARMRTDEEVDRAEDRITEDRPEVYRPEGVSEAEVDRPEGVSEAEVYRPEGVSEAESESVADVEGVGTAGEPPSETTDVLPTTAGTALWGDDAVRDLRDRWRDAQLWFVDDPRRAADEAKRVVADAVDRLTAAVGSRREDLDRWPGGDGDETERLRLAVRAYREFLDRLLAL